MRRFHRPFLKITLWNSILGMQLNVLYGWRMKSYYRELTWSRDSGINTECNLSYYMAVFYKDWEPLNTQIWLAEIWHLDQLHLFLEKLQTRIQKYWLFSSCKNVFHGSVKKKKKKNVQRTRKLWQIMYLWPWPRFLHLDLLLGKS